MISNEIKDDRTALGCLVFGVAMTILFATLLLWFTPPARAADAQCGPMDDMLHQLFINFQEVPVFTGNTRPDVDITVTVSPSTSWTIIAQHEGIGCIVADGQKWAAAAAPDHPPAIVKPSAPALEAHGIILIRGNYPSVGPRSDFFQGLKQPDTGISCCSISDCKRTEADWRAGQWWANITGQWTPIPPGKVLSNKSIDGDAYVCSNSARDVYCFVKPDRGF